ncbi:disease resistance protein RPM1 isoform X3 [Manihot esculenta]|uniref:Uncharacterized protein n=2 Tax=Manihot esculenta TaxID=3983 RepID=A0A2C9U2N7_MANES|nr:disease resistance protein RPM1 isoform X3 [Manihot esculenta]
MASVAVDHVIGTIMSALQEEATLLVGIKDELEEISKELVSMRSFLQDAERNKVMSKGEETWVAEVRDTAHQIEDLIDEYMYYMYRKQYSTVAHRIFLTPKSLLEKRRIASKLQQINKNIIGMDERRKRFGNDHVEGSNAHCDLTLYPRDSAVFMKEDDVVGFVDESRLLKTWLIDGEKHLTLISVVGMGGSGKTTLVAKTCNNETAKSYFDCYAWVTVSQTYARDDLLRKLIKECHESGKARVPNDLGTKDFKDLVEYLIGYLKHKKYLVILDDVWDISLWENIKASLPNNEFGSRIIFTTRNEDVGSFSSNVRSHMLTIKPLKNEEAWDLFCKKAFFSNPDKSCPEELKPLALELVGKCDGLPLAIVALGGVMSSKKSTSEWSSVWDNLNWQLNSNPRLEIVKSILLLSFNYLPSPLKYCFLYCCLFPEDYKIRRQRLIRLWIAEGFIQNVDRTTPNEVAESYFMELTLRSMLQVGSRNACGRPRACQMHDLLREIGISMLEREKFGVVYDGKIKIKECQLHQARRLSIQTTNGDLQSYGNMRRLRSLLVFVDSSVSFSSTSLPNLKLMRSLDLENVAINILPEGLGTLLNLRYLNLRGTQVQKLPKSIGKLRNLESLDITNTKVKELPSEVAELQNLYHLIMWSKGIANNLGDFLYLNGLQVPFKISKLKKLQVLYYIEAKGDIIRQLGSMTQLRRMGISNLREADEHDLCSSILNLKLIRTLRLYVNNEAEFLRMDALETPPPQLQKLGLHGKLERVPHWFCSLQNLTSLGLLGSSLEEDQLPHVAALPNLGRVTLINSFVGENLHFYSGFAKLKELYLFKFRQLKGIIIEKGAMPDIQKLWIDSCFALDAVPRGIEFLTNLQTMWLTNFSSSLIDMKSIDRSKLQHIPNVNIIDTIGRVLFLNSDSSGGNGSRDGESFVLSQYLQVCHFFK